MERYVIVIFSDNEFKEFFYRRRMKIKSYHWVLQPAHLVTFTKRGLQSARHSGHAGGVKHTLQETDLCHAGGTESPPSAM